MMNNSKIFALSQVCRLITDGKHGDCDDESDSGYFFISAKDVKDGKIHYEDARQITRADFENTHRRTKLEPEDILITNSGTIGRLAIVPDTEITRRTTFQKSVAIIKPDTAVIFPKFLYYTFQAQLQYLIEMAGGTAQKNLLLGDLRRFKCRIPSPMLQRKIAAILSAYDELIENNKRRIALLEKMAEEIYREWFVRLRFPGHEKVKFVKSVPQGWRIAELKELASVNPSSMNRRDKTETILYVDISSVSTNRIDEVTTYTSAEAPGRARRRVKHGDVIWSSVRPANRAYCLIYEPPENLIVSTGFAVIRPNAVTPFTFLFFAVTSDPFVDQMTTVAKGAAYPATSFDDFEKAKLLVPSDELLNRFHENAEPLFQQKHLLQLQIDRLKQTRNLLLPRLVSGKLSVENLDIQFPPGMAEELKAEPIAAAYA